MQNQIAPGFKLFKSRLVWINFLPPRKFFMLFCCLLIFFKINFFEKFFQEYNLSVKQLDPYQAQHFVGPDLGPICLQRL